MLPVGEWGDDKAISAAKELVLIDGVHVADSYNTLVIIFTEVEARLFQPFEVFRAFDLHANLAPDLQKILR